MADVFEQDGEISNHEVSDRENSRSTDLDSLVSFQQLIKESWRESKKLWRIAGPSSFTRLCSYSTLLITNICAGHLGVVELAAVAIQDSVIGGLAFGFKNFNITLKEQDLHIHIRFIYIPIRCRISEES
ncbi:hypothetical protein SUGI_0862040 [Cryptomeria japonica]|nr:hypothetical protein SUGI_0862040 [Cryptomeria japonica]